MTAAAKGYKGIGMEGFIARWYAKSTGNAMKDYTAEARRVAALLAPGAQVLEVAPGPGYFSIELAKLGDYRITGLDISKSMVEIAQRNAASAGVAVEFRLGNASQMPFESNRFDFLFCRAAFKNFSQPVRALEEMHRVLKPGGCGLIGDLRRDAPPDGIHKAVSDLGMTGFDAWFTRMAFRFMLTKRAYLKPEFERMLAQTQFRSTRIEQNGIGMEIWMEK